MNRLDELISRFLDEDLTSDERIELQNAIEADPRGADELLAYYQQDRLLSALLRPSSADAVNTILAAVSAEDCFVDSVMRQARAAAADECSRRRKEADLSGEIGQNCPPPHVGGYERPGSQTDSKAKHNWLARVIAKIGFWMELDPLTRPSSTLSPSDGERDGVRGHREMTSGKQSRLFPWPRWAFAVATVALIGLLVWLFLPVNNQPTLTVATGTQVTLERNGQSSTAQDGLKLLPGDLLSTTTNRSTLVTYRRENTRIIISPDTSLKILSWKEGKRFELRQGRIEATVAQQTTGRPMIWRTPQAEAKVVGTELALEVATNTTTLEVVEGKVELTSTDNRQSIQLTNSQYAVAAPGIALNAKQFLRGRGTILREYWLGIETVHVGNLTHHASYPNRPSGREYLSSFAGPTNWGVDYGGRFRGFLHPSKTGVYTFWITANHSAQLWLSSDETPDHAEMVASLSLPAPVDQWDNFPWQKSEPIKLQAGRKYYIEALHKASNAGSDHCSVAWQLPGGKREVIPGKFLSPFPVKEKKAK